MRYRVVAAVAVGSVVLASGAPWAAPGATKPRGKDVSTREGPPRALDRQHPWRVLTRRSPGAGDIRYGFEGGRVGKVRDTYHLFTSEMAGDPVWVKMRLGHWTSRDRLEWRRDGTVAES